MNVGSLYLYAILINSNFRFNKWQDLKKIGQSHSHH